MFSYIYSKRNIKAKSHESEMQMMLCISQVQRTRGYKSLFVQEEKPMLNGGCEFLH